MQNQKASDVKTKKSKNNQSQTENLSATAEGEVTMVPILNQTPANFANRIEKKSEAKTKHPSATAEKNMTKTFRHKPKN